MLGKVGRVCSVVKRRNWLVPDGRKGWHEEIGGGTISKVDDEMARVMNEAACGYSLKESLVVSASLISHITEQDSRSLHSPLQC